MSQLPVSMDKLKAAKKEFVKQYGHLWSNIVPGGINGVGIGIAHAHSNLIGITVYIESSQEVFDKIPDEIEGEVIHKKIIGKITAL